MARAGCLGMDPNIFYPHPGDPVEPAREVCRTCPVKPECLEYGLMVNDPGIWGGLTHRERKLMRKAMAVRPGEETA